MAIDVYFDTDIRARLLAGVVLAVQTARATGANVEYIRGILAGAQHTALSFGLSWPDLLEDARRALDGGDSAHLRPIGGKQCTIQRKNCGV